MCPYLADVLHILVLIITLIIPESLDVLALTADAAAAKKSSIKTKEGTLAIRRTLFPQELALKIQSSNDFLDLLHHT